MGSASQELNIEFLEVDSVKALAAKFGNSYDVPGRYVRPEAHTGEVIRDASFQLPVVDLESLRDPLLAINEIAKLRSACREWGFFQLINHGVQEEIINNMKSNITEFFMLPLEQKKTVGITRNDTEGFGQHFVMSDDQKLDWGDLFFINTQPIEKRNLKAWPTNPSGFRDTVDKYSHELKELFKYLLEFLAKGLEIEPEVLFRGFKENRQCMRMNCYPPCPRPEKVLGLSPHTDSGCLSILLQVNDVQGLQIRKDDKWFSVEALPGAFVVNIGGALEILSNGIYRSIEHRAVVNSAKERISIATFNNPSLSGTVGPLPEVVKGGKENYKAVTGLEYTRGFFSAKFAAGRSYVESMKLNN